jgi:hypothetical protein
VNEGTKRKLIELSIAADELLNLLGEAEQFEKKVSELVKGPIKVHRPSPVQQSGSPGAEADESKSSL